MIDARHMLRHARAMQADIHEDEARHEASIARDVADTVRNKDPALRDHWQGLHHARERRRIIDAVVEALEIEI